MKLSLLGAALALAVFPSLEGCSARIAPRDGTTSMDASPIQVTVGSSSSSSAGNGALEMQIALPDSQHFATIQWTLTAAAGMARFSGSVSSGPTHSASFLIPNVPSGAYSIAIEATTTEGYGCTGAGGPWTIRPSATWTEDLGLACNVPVDAGCCQLPTKTTECGDWTSLTKTSGSAYVGDSITFTATATGPAPSMLVYTWSASDPGVGHFITNDASGTLDAASFQCDAPGATDVTLVVSEGSAGPGACESSTYATVTDAITCLALPGSADPGDAGALDSASD